MVIERRDFPRLHVVWKATVARLNGEQLPGSTDNVSRDGMNVIIGKELVLGEPVKVEIVSKCIGQTCFFTLQGVIVYNYVLDSNLGCAVGLRIMDPDSRFIHMMQNLEGDDQQVVAV